MSNFRNLTKLKTDHDHANNEIPEDFNKFVQKKIVRLMENCSRYSEKWSRRWDQNFKTFQNWKNSTKLKIELNLILGVFHSNTKIQPEIYIHRGKIIVD